MCSPCGPMVCYKYEDCGPRCSVSRDLHSSGMDFRIVNTSNKVPFGTCAERALVLSLARRPVRRACVAHPREDLRHPVQRLRLGLAMKGKSNDPSGAEEGGAEKKGEKENQLKRTKSRELRGGIMYYSCHCIKRNGLQHDCRRTGCGGEPPCLVLPDPLCAPSQLARARGLADPEPLAAHIRAASGGGPGGVADAGPGSGKRFIVCELKGIVPDATTDKGGKCCCSAPSGGGGGASASGGPAPGLPVMVMKLC